MKTLLLAATALSLLASSAWAATCTTAICKTDGTLTVNSGGTITVASGGTLTAASGSTVSLAGTQTFTSTLTLDDGTGASPSFVMQDETNEAATFSKVDAGFLTITTVAGDGVQVTTGNLKVGNGTPTVVQDGEDAYVEGTLEVDGASRFEGAITATSDLSGDGGDQLVGFLNNQVAATATTITAAQCGSTFISGGAVEMELPEASTVLGCRLTFVVNHASNFTIDPDAGDQIALLTNAAGDSLIADAVGESIVLEAISASQWAPIGAQQGTWTDSN